MISAIIVTYNSEGCIGDCLAALSGRLEAEDEILVVDNGSTDGTGEAVARVPAARWLPQGCNRGFGSAVNVGARAAGQPLLLIVNPDLTVSHLDRAGLSVLLGTGRIGLLAGRTAEGEDSAGHGSSPVRNQLGPLTGAWRLAMGPLRPKELAHGDLSGRLAGVAARRGRTWVSGALLLAGREEFLDVGGFNEDLFMYGEDRYLSATYLSRGLPVGVTDAVGGRHAVASSSERSPADTRQLRAWAVLGWVEFLSDFRGPRSARTGWFAYRALVSAAQSVLSVAATLSGRSRFARKLTELDGITTSLDSIVESGGSIDGRIFCPSAIDTARSGPKVGFRSGASRRMGASG